MRYKKYLELFLPDSISKERIEIKITIDGIVFFNIPITRLKNGKLAHKK